MVNSHRQSSSIVSFIAVAALIAAGIYFVNRGFVANQGGALDGVQPDGIQPAPAITVADEQADDEPTFPLVLVATRNNGETKIVGRAETDDRLYFTDRDEGTKVAATLGTNYADQLYLFVGGGPTQPTGTVARVATDGSGTLTNLSGDLPTTSPPSISSNASQLAYVGFDNAEGSFGFTLFSDRTSGGQLRSVDSSPAGISLPRWSPGGGLAYVVGQATPDNGQEVRAKSETGSTTIFSSDKGQIISDLCWLGNDRLALVVEPLGNNTANQAKILIIKLDGTTVTTIDLTGKERSLRATSSGEILAAIAGEVKGIEAGDGTVTLIDVDTGKTIERGSARFIAGFLE